MRLGKHQCSAKIHGMGAREGKRRFDVAAKVRKRPSRPVLHPRDKNLLAKMGSLPQPYIKKRPAKN